MESVTHSISALFAQLGLPDDNSAIEQFIGLHRPLPPTVKLAEAEFWTPSQQTFLQESIARDADWAEVVDELDALLRH